jgi:hypothetical protein
MLPQPKQIKSHRCGIAQYTDEDGEHHYLCPKCFHPVVKEEIPIQAPVPTEDKSSKRKKK